MYDVDNRLTCSKNSVTMLSWLEKPCKLVKPTTHQLIVGGISITWLQKVKYLDLMFDNNLLYNHYTKELSTRMITLLKKLYHLLNRNSRLCPKNQITVYKQIIFPVVTYGIPVRQRSAYTNMQVGPQSPGGMKSFFESIRECPTLDELQRIV